MPDYKQPDPRKTVPSITSNSTASPEEKTVVEMIARFLCKSEKGIDWDDAFHGEQTRWLQKAKEFVAFLQKQRYGRMNQEKINAPLLWKIISEDDKC